MKRVIAYVDGFNLYFGLRAKGWKRFYWLNIRKVSEHLLRPDQTLAATNTATAITLNTTGLSNGVTLTSGSRLNVVEAGFYQIDFRLQLQSGSGSAKTAYVWLRKNGSNEANTTRAFTSNINNGETPLSVTYTISLAAADYVELYWAADSTNVTLNALAASAFAPAAPSVLVNVSQLQL